MDIKRFGSNGRTSTTVRHSNVVYLSAQKPDDVTGDITQQAKSVFTRIDKLLALQGTDKNHILSATVYLKSMDDYAGMNSVWDEWVIDNFEPARTCVEAAMSIPEYLISVSVIAAVD